METLHDGEVYEGEQFIANVRYWIKEAVSGRFPVSVPTTMLRLSGLPNGLDGRPLILYLDDDRKLRFTIWAGEAKCDGDPYY